MNKKNPTGGAEKQPAEPLIEGISLPGKTLRESAIWRSAPDMMDETPEGVALFRRRVESELRMLCSYDNRPSPEEVSRYLDVRAAIKRTPLSAALFRIGMLDALHISDNHEVGYEWIKRSLPVLSRSPLTKDMAAFYWREAACFAGKHGNWKQVLEFARKGVRLLPKDVSKILWAAEVHRVLAVAFLKLKRFKECKARMAVVTDLAKAHGENYGQALWVRIHMVKEELARAAGDRSSELVAKLCGIAALDDSMPFNEVQRAEEVRMAWCQHVRPEWIDDSEEFKYDPIKRNTGGWGFAVVPKPKSSP
jgi:hypothetical protein